ncbi:hypothetical protein ACEUZ9_002862 [Paracoccus litorisediminis]|uniref:hypothetical protein n=1 Tax=Paracoccus litorisediminis TaxID=2006130 RepID=UPI003733FE67
MKSNSKGKIIAVDHGGLMLAAAQAHPDVAARREQMTDTIALDGAAGKLEVFATVLEELEKMTPGAPAFDAPVTTSVKSARTLPAAPPAESDVDGEAETLLIGGLDSDETVNFEASFSDESDADPLAGFDLDAASLGEDAVMVASAGSDLLDAAAGLEAEFNADFGAEFGKDPVAGPGLMPAGEDVGFDGIGEDEADMNAQISDEIIKFNEFGAADQGQAPVDAGESWDSDLGGDEFSDVPDAAQDQTDAADASDFDNIDWDQSDLGGLVDRARVDSRMDGTTGLPFSPILEGDDVEPEEADEFDDWDAEELLAGLDDGAAENIEAGRPAARNQPDLDAEFTAHSGGRMAAHQARDDWSAAGNGLEGHDLDDNSEDGNGLDGSRDAFFSQFADEKPVEPAQDIMTATRAQTDRPSWAPDPSDPISWEDEGESGASGLNDQGNPVDGAAKAIPGFALSDDIIADAGADAPETEGETEVAALANRKQEFTGLDTDLDLGDEEKKVVPLKATRKAKPGLTAEIEDENEDDGFAAASAAKKAKMKMLAASAGIVALLGGVGFFVAKPMLFPTQSPIAALPPAADPQIVAPTATAAIAAPLFAETPAAPATTAAPAAAVAPVQTGAPIAPPAPSAPAPAAEAPNQPVTLAADPGLAPTAAPRVTADPASIFASPDPLTSIANGLAGADSAADLALPVNVPVEAGPFPVETIAPAIELDKKLEGYVKEEEFSELAGGIDQLKAAMDEFRGAIEMKDEQIGELQAKLSDAGAQAARAEQLALAQNEVLVKVIRVSDKIDMAESLIVDLSRRVASIETTDPADRVAVERSLEQLDGQVKSLTRDIGMIARVAINGSPSTLPGAAEKAKDASKGSDPVFAEGKGTKMPPVSEADVPANAKKGDFVEGYGYVLDIIPTSDGSNLIVMENGSVLK